MPLSLIEFGVYGFITYASFLMLIISSVKEIPDSKSHAIVRSVYLIPAVICAILLASSGDVITLESTSNTIVAVNTTEVFTEAFTNNVTLINPVWVLVHFMLAAVLIVYILTQVLIMLTKI